MKSLKFTPIVLLLSINVNLAASSGIEKQDIYYNDSSSYDVSFYDINIEVNNTYLFKAFSSFKAKVTTRPLDKLYFELFNAFTIDSVLLNNKKQDFTRDSDWIKISVISPLAINEIFNVTVFYNDILGDGSYADMFSRGIFYYNNDTSVYSSTEPFNASKVFPCKQIVSDKCDSANFNIIAPAGKIAVANGILKEKINLSGNRTLFKWETRYQTAYYLLSFAVSDFKEHSYKFYDKNYGDSISYQNYLMESDFNKASLAFIDTVPWLIQTYEKILGIKYPFRKEKYGNMHTMFSGGMENQTLTNLGFIDLWIIAHELSHSWFGDLVTCNNWQDIWINEGFASYMEYYIFELINSSQANKWLEEALVNTYSSSINDPRSSLFISESDKWNPYRIFNLLAYKKGALVLHMLRNKINNDSIFFQCLNNFLTKFSYSNAGTEDFKKVVEETTGFELDDFFQDWVYNKGIPLLTVKKEIDGKNLNLAITQKNLCGDSLFNFELAIKVNLKNNIDTTIKITQSDTTRKYSYQFSSEISTLETNPNYNLFYFAPEFLPNSNYTAYLGKYCSNVYKISNPSYLSLTYSTEGLPEGLISFSSDPGFYGFPKKTGVFPLRILMYYNNHLIDTLSKTIIVEESNVMPELNINKTNITLAPNPSSDFITIHYPEETQIFKIYIFNSEGKLIELPVLKKNQLDVRQIKSGLYYLKVIGKDFEKSLKFIKK